MHHSTGLGFTPEYSGGESTVDYGSSPGTEPSPDYPQPPRGLVAVGAAGSRPRPLGEALLSQGSQPWAPSLRAGTPPGQTYELHVLNSSGSENEEEAEELAEESSRNLNKAFAGGLRSSSRGHSPRRLPEGQCPARQPYGVRCSLSSGCYPYGGI